MSSCCFSNAKLEEKALANVSFFYYDFSPHFYQLGISVVCLCLVDCMSHGREAEVNLL